MIGSIEFRTEQDPDVARYTHPKDISGGWGAGGALAAGELPCTANIWTMIGLRGELGHLDWRHAGTKVGLAPHCHPCSPAAGCHTRPAVQVVHPSREAEQLRSQLLGLIRNALQPLQRDRVGCVPCGLAAGTACCSCRHQCTLRKNPALPASSGWLHLCLALFSQLGCCRCTVATQTRTRCTTFRSCRQAVVAVVSVPECGFCFGWLGTPVAAPLPTHSCALLTAAAGAQCGGQQQRPRRAQPLLHCLLAGKLGHLPRCAVTFSQRTIAAGPPACCMPTLCIAELRPWHHCVCACHNPVSLAGYGAGAGPGPAGPVRRGPGGRFGAQFACRINCAVAE